MKDCFFIEIYNDINPKEKICEWNFIQVENRDVRVYYKPSEEEGSGFEFYAVQNTGGVCTPEYTENNWHPKDCYVECVFKGIAYWDGIRHLYMGDETTDNYGYHYYPVLEKSIETLKVVRELEKKYCSEYE